MGLAAATVYAMIHFGLIEVDSLLQAFQKGSPWLAAAFLLGLFSTLVNLVRYSKLLRLLGINISGKSTIAATSVSLFAGQWLPGSMAVSEALRVGLMVGATRLADTSLEAGAKARIFVASFLDRACGLIVFLSIGSLASAVALGLGSHAANDELAKHEFSILVGLMILGFCGAASLLSLPWLAKHPKPLALLNKMLLNLENHSGLLGKMFHRILMLLKQVTGPMTESSFTQMGFYKALSVSAVSNVACIFLFLACAKAVGSEMTFLQVAAVFPFLALAQILPIGFGGIGGHQLVAVALFQAFTLDASGVATVSLLQSVVSFLINSFIGVFFLQTSAKQLKAILKKPTTNLNPV